MPLCLLSRSISVILLNFSLCNADRRLNEIQDEGAKTLLEAAICSKTIQSLNMSTTQMGEQVRSGLFAKTGDTARVG